MAMLVCGALGIVTWKFEEWFPRKTKTGVLYELKEFEITRVEVIVPANLAWTCERQHQGGIPASPESDRRNPEWKIVKPAVYEVDPSVIQDFVKRIARVEVSRKFSGGTNDFAWYGLTAPRWVMTVALKAGGQKVLMVGNKTPDGQNYYVREASDPSVYTAPLWSVEPLQKTVTDLRQKEIWRFPQGEVDFLKVEGVSAKVCARDGGGAWKINGQPANGTMVHQLLGSLRYAKVSRFPDDFPRDLKKYGLAPPRSVVTIKGHEGKSLFLKLLIGKESGFGIFVKVDGQKPVYEIESHHFGLLLKPFKDYLEEKKNTLSP